MRDPRQGLTWSAHRLETRLTYSTYMDSPAWFSRRERWMTEWTQSTGMEPSCLVCGGNWSLRHGDLHHRTYDRLCDEQWYDLIPLCRPCHGTLHACIEGNPEWRKRPRHQATDALVAHLRHEHNEIADNGDHR
jgi:hypothetical protein